MATEDLLPVSDESSTGTIAYIRASTPDVAPAWNLLDDDDDDTNHIRFDSNGFISLNMADLTAKPVTINGITVTVKYADVGAHDTQEGKMFLKIGGTKYYGTVESLVVSGGTHAEITFTWTANPANGEAFTLPVVNALIAGFEVQNFTANAVKVSFLKATVDHYVAPATTKVVRHLASMAQWLNRRPESTAIFTGDLDCLDVETFGGISLDHIAGPHETLEGWGPKSWQLQPFDVHGHDTDLDALKNRVTLWYRRPYRANFVYLAWSDKASGAIENGIMRFHVPGTNFYFSRATTVSITNPTGESESVGPGVPAYPGGGLLIGADDVVQLGENPDEGRNWEKDQGTFFCEVNLTAVSGAANQTVVYVYQNASNWAWVYWDGANGRWVFEIRAQGVTYQATKSATPSSATWYQIGARWTGANAELDETAYTASVWVDGVKGTDVVVGSAYTHGVVSPGLWIGTKGGAGVDELNGQIRKIHHLPYVYTDEEMARPI